MQRVIHGTVQSHHSGSSPIPGNIFNVLHSVNAVAPRLLSTER
jgi:hypothetical protein